MTTIPNIVTVTFSPCIDKSTSVPALIPEKKLKCAAPKLEPGGGGINVARAIIKLGGEAIAVYPAGGYTGKYFNQLLEDEKVPSVIIESKEETRENIIILEESTNRQYRFGMPGTLLQEKEWQQILGRIEEMKDPAFIVASGSLPPGVPDDILARIARIAKKKNAKFIADASGKSLLLAIEEGLYMIKPNLGELSSIAGKEHLTEDEVPAIARHLIEKGNCEMIVVSMGPAGALLVTNDASKIIKPPAVKTKSTVGAGDSMVAGIVLSLSKGKSPEEATRYGVACGTAATMNAGTELCRLKDVEKLYSLLSTDIVYPA
jgi:6-phosphofructokinase 2